MAWLAGWGFRKEVTIQDTHVDGNLTDYPAYVKLDADVDIGDEALATGFDIRFTQSDGDTLLKYQRVYWMGGAGPDATAHFFVKVPSILAAGGAIIYIYYGNAGAADGEDAANVWDTNYKGVWHLDESGDHIGEDYLDSSGNSNHGQGGDGTASKVPTQVNGKFHKANEFDGVEDWIKIDATGTTDLTGGDWTVEAWVYPDDYGSSYPSFYHDGQWGLSVGMLGGGSPSPIEVWIDNGFSITSTGTVAAMGWRHITVTYDGVNYNYYIDGIYDSQDAAGNYNNNGEVGIGGNDASGGSYWDGKIQEVRISNTDRTAAWIKFNEANIDEADNELTWGSEETAGLTISPAGIVSAETFGTPQLNLRLLPSAIASLEAFGTTVIYNSDQYVLPSGILSAEAFGMPALGLYILPSAIASLEAFGTPQLNLQILASAIASLEAFGTPTLGLYILPSGIASAEAFGTTIIYNSDQYILLSGIPSAEAIGSHTVTTGTQYLQPSAIGSFETFGSHQLNLRIEPSAIASLEAFGTPQLNLQILASAIASLEAFGTTILYNSDQYIVPNGIISLESFGTLFIYIPTGIIPEFYKLEPRERIYKLVARDRIKKLKPSDGIKEKEN